MLLCLLFPLGVGETVQEADPSFTKEKNKNEKNVRTVTANRFGYIKKALVGGGKSNTRTNKYVGKSRGLRPT